MATPVPPDLLPSNLKRRQQGTAPRASAPASGTPVPKELLPGYVPPSRAPSTSTPPAQPTRPTASAEADSARQGVLAQIERKKREIAYFQRMVAEKTGDPLTLYSNIAAAQEDIGTLQNQLNYIAQRGKAPPAPTLGTYARQLKEVPSTVYQFPGQVVEGILGGLGTALQTAGRSGVGRAAVGLAALPFGGAPLVAMAPKESLRATGEALSRAGTRAELENRLQAEAIFGKPSEEAQYYPGIRRAQQLSQAVGSTIPYIATEGVAGALGAAGKARTAARAAKAVEAAQAAGAAEMALPAASRLEQAARATRAAAYPMAGAQGSQQAGQKAQQFREQGGQVSPEQELRARLSGFGLGLTEVGAINRMVQGVPSGARGAAVDAVSNFLERATLGKVAPEALMAGVKETIEQVESRALGRMALSGFEESGQEGLVQFGQNLAAQQIYNPNQDLMEGVGESALIGGLVGGGIRGGVEGYRTATGANKQAALEKQYRELQAQPALASFELAVPNPADPAMVTRQAVDVISAPDADGKVVVRYPDGTLARRSVETLEASRVPEGAFYPSDAFSKDMIGGRLTSVLGEKPTKQAVDTADALNRKLNNDIALGDIQASSGYIADLEKRFSGARKAKARQQMTEGGVSAIEDPALRVLYEAKSIVNDYRVEYAKAQAQPGARVGDTPTPVGEGGLWLQVAGADGKLEWKRVISPPSAQSELTLRQMIERNQAGPPTVSNLRFQLQALIDEISTDPDITDKQGAFNEALARTGLGEAIDQQGRTPMEILRAESEAETEAVTGMPQLDEQQAAERAAIIDAAVRRTNYTPEEKISLIDAELLRAQQDPLTAEEEARVVRRAQAGNVFGPTGEYQQALEAETATVADTAVTERAPTETPAVDRQAAFAEANRRYPGNDMAATAFYNAALGKTLDEATLSVADNTTLNAYEAGQRFRSGQEEGAVATEPEVAKAAKPVEKQGPPVTVVKPGEARGVRPVARGTQGTTVGRPVEGAEELTPGMQDIQALTKRLETMRNNNMITDRDVASALSKVREGLSGTQETIDQLFAKREATTNKAERNALTNTIKSLEIKLEEQRSSLAAEAGKAAAKAAGKRRLQMAKVNSDYQTGKITKAERDRRLRAIKVEGHLFPVMSLREDAASELIINPDAEGRPLEVGTDEEIAEGTEQILARLDKAVEDGDITPEARDFTKWVLDSNPNLTRFAQLYVSKETGQPYAGQYDPIGRLIEVVSGPSTGTSIHEILHHAERLMPDSAQSAIRGLWETRLNIKRYASQGDAKAYLNLIHEFYFGNQDPRNLQFARMLLSDGSVPRGLYQFFTPSEFWAENATDILRQRFDVKDSTLGRIRQWLKEFASHLGNFVGLPTRSTVIRKLNQLANTDGTSKSSGLIAGTEGPAFIFGGRSTSRLRFDEQTQYDTARILAGMGNPAGPGSKVHQQTGWFKAADGMWRFEFSDEGAKLTDAWDKLPETKFTGDVYELPLEQILDHPLLYKYYPAARNIKVRKQSGFLDWGTLQGSFNEKTNTLTITPYAKSPIDTIVHEIQHWVQGQEDFARGGNKRSALEVVSESRLADYRDAALSRTAEQLRKAVALRDLQRAIYQAPELEAYLAAEDHLDNMTKSGDLDERIAARAERRAADADLAKVWDAYSKLLDGPDSSTGDYGMFKYMARDNRLKDSIERADKKVAQASEAYDTIYSAKGRDALIKALADTDEAYEAYQSLFGEVEARSAATRRDYDAAKRKEQVPYDEQGIPPSQYILTRNGGVSASEEGPPSNKPLSQDLLKFIDQLETDVNRSKVDRVGIYASLQKMLKPLDGAKSAVTRKINYDLQDAPDTDRWLAQQLGVDRLPDNMSLEAQASVLKSSRSSRQILLDRNYIQPIVSKIAELGLDSQDIGMYLWARSAKDRNAVVRSRNGAFPEAGSGMSDAEAQSYLREFDQAGLTPKLETVAKLHDRLVDYLLNLRVEEGLLTRKQAQAARQLQPFYTPLKGYAAEGDMQDMGDADPHSEPTYRANLGIKRSEYMKTQGRKSMPYNPLYMLVADAKELVNRVAVNRVGLRLLDNLMRDPDLFAGVASYYTDSDPKITYKPNENTEYPDGIPVRHNMRMERGKYLVVKKDGTPYYIEFADTDAGNSARRLFANMQVKQLPLLARAWIRSANSLKSMLTRFSVPYLPTAYLRDIQDAATKAFSAETDIKSPAYGKQFGARVAANITMTTPTGRLINSAVRQFAFGLEPKTEEQAEMALLLQQMMEDGGAPGHAVLHDVERLTADAEKQIKRAIALQRNNPVAYATAAPRAIVNTLDAVSQIIDLKARLASYVAALEAGIDRNGAARLALNSSLDLTRRGEWATTLDSLFFFWSPSVESLRQSKRMAFNSSNGRKAIMTTMAAGAALTLWSMWMGSGDDDGDGRSNYEDIPDGVKQTSLIFMWGPGADDYWRLPLGFGLSFPAYVGQKITEAGVGAISEGAAAISILDSLREVAAGAVTTFSPIKPRGADPSQFVMSFVPNLAKPFVEAYANLNAFGSPIYTPNVTGDRSAASLGREDTGRVWQWLSNSINDMTGGRGTVSGGTDISPEALRYLFESFAGGTYRAGESAVKLITEDAKQDESLVQRLPIVQSFTGRSERYAAMNNYFKNTTQQYSFPFIQSQPEMDQLVSQEKHEPDIFALTSEDYPLRTSYEVMEAYKEAKRELDRIGRDRRAALAETEDRQARLDILEDARLQKDEVYKVFNRIYNEAAREQRSQ